MVPVTSTGNVFSKSRCRNPSKLGNSSSPSRSKVSRSTKPLTPNFKGHTQLVPKRRWIRHVPAIHQILRRVDWVELHATCDVQAAWECLQQIEERRSRTSKIERPSTRLRLVVDPDRSRNVVARNQISLHQRLVKLQRVQEQPQVGSDGVGEMQCGCGSFQIDDGLRKGTVSSKGTSADADSVNCPKYPANSSN